MIGRRVTMCVSALALALAAVMMVFPDRASLQDLGPTGPSPYEVVDGWLQPFASEGFALGGNSGVFAESPDRIFIAQRGETRLPDPVPSGFAGFVGSIGINALRGEGRVWQHCIFVVDGDGNLIEVWDQWDHLFEGSEGPGPHRIRISPLRPGTSRVGGSRDGASDLRLLERWQRVVDDAR